jgi:hypothetical protein
MLMRRLILFFTFRDISGIASIPADDERETGEKANSFRWFCCRRLADTVDMHFSTHSDGSTSDDHCVYFGFIAVAVGDVKPQDPEDRAY